MEVVLITGFVKLFSLNSRQELNETFDFFIGNDAIPGGHSIVWATFADGVVGHIFPLVLVTNSELA
jgi:hypothetical protein